MSNSSAHAVADRRPTRLRNPGPFQIQYAYTDRPAREAFVSILESSPVAAVGEFAGMLRRTEPYTSVDITGFDRLCTQYAGNFFRIAPDQCPLKLELQGPRLTLTYRDEARDVVATLVLERNQKLRLEGSGDGMIALDEELNFGSNWQGTDKPLTLAAAVEAQGGAPIVQEPIDDTRVFVSKHAGHG